MLLGRPAAAKIESSIFRGGETLHAPHLIDLEVLQVLRRFEAAGEINARRAQNAIQDLQDFPMNRYPHTFMLDRVWLLRSNLTAYDAAYVSLAEALRATLLTCDARLSRSRTHRARIELVTS